MANYLSPIFNEQTFDANGDPLVGGKLYTYQAGTSTAQATYTTQDGVTQQANPIILNSRGEPANPIWLAAGSEYKFILKDSNDVTLRTVDDIGGVNDISSAADQWVLYSVAPTYVSATSFTVPGDQTNTFHVGRRLKTTNTGGTIYSRISASAYGSSTTVTVVNDSGTLDSGLSAVSYGFLTATNPSTPNSQAVRQAMGLGYGADIASAATLDLTARTGQLVRITGSTGPITALTMANGDQVMLEMVSTPTFNVSGVLSYTCVAGDNIFVWQDGNGTQGAFVLKHLTASTTQVGEVELATDAETLTGTDTARAVTPSNLGATRGMVKLNSGTASAASSIDIVMTSYTAFRNKELVLDYISPSVDGTNLYLRVSTDGGSTYDAGASDYVWGYNGMLTSGTATDQSSSGDIGIVLSLSVGNAAGESVNAKVTIFGTNDATKNPRCLYDCSTVSTLGTFISLRGAGARTATQDTDAIRVIFGSGTITGTWALYGWN